MATTSSRLAISLAPEDAQALRVTAARYGTTTSLLVRALLRYGLGRLEDQELQGKIEDEIAQERARRAAVGKAAMKSRYGSQNSDNPR